MQTLPLTETLRVGGDEDPVPGQELFAPTRLVVASDGTIFALDWGAREVVVLDSAGTIRNRIGRAGQGPGEFYHPMGIALADDTVFVLDQYLHAFALDGTVHYSSAIEPPSGVLTTPHAFVFTPSNLLIARVHQTERRSGDDGLHVDTVQVFERSPHTGQLSQAVGMYEGEAYYFRGRRTRLQSTLTGQPYVALARDGTVLYSTGQEYRIDVRTPDGRLLSSSVGAIPRQRIPDDVFNDLMKQAERNAKQASRSQPDGEDVAGYFRTIPRPEFRAVLGRLLPGDDGLVLAERPDLGPLTGAQGVDSHWDLIHLDTGLIGRVTMPAAFMPMWFQNDQLYGLEMTEMGSTMVVRYRIER